jgi:hypothetical protein
MYKKTILTVTILLLTFAVNAQNWFGGSEKIKGNGNVVTENRTTSNFKGISVGGSFDVVLVKGKEGKISIEGEENIIPHIETEVSDNILKIRFKRNTNIKTTKRLTVTVNYENIESLALGGSGNISSLSLIKTDNFKVSLGGSGSIAIKVDANFIKASVGGSGSINLEGVSEQLTCSIAGSGSIKAYGLKTNKVDANVAGSGSVKTTVKTKIKAKLVGSGSVYYKGKPKNVDSKSVGSGSLVDRN